MSTAPWPVLAVILAAVLADAAGQEADRAEDLDIARAHQLALANAPNITVARLTALEALDQVAIARAGYLPAIGGYATLARAGSGNTRIGAGALNNPSVFDREALGITASQLITDFGRTSNVIEAAKERAHAEQSRSQAAIDQVLLDVDLFYYRTLQCQARLEVARKTVAYRKLLVDRVTGLVANQIKSELDLSFAQVGLGEGEMLAAQVANELQTDELSLATLLGYDRPQPFRLIDEPIAPPGPYDPDRLVAQALLRNPAVQRLRFEVAAAMRTDDAERALDYPVISAIGAAGVILDHDSRLPDSYVAGAINLSVPLYAGGALADRQHAAELRAAMARASLRAAEDDLSRNVRVAIANATYAYDRLGMSAKLLEQSSQALALAEARFGLGLVSLIDLTQAELAKTDAAMMASTAKQEYLMARAILANRLGESIPAQAAPARGPGAGP